MSQRINEVKTYVSLPRLMIAGVRPGDGQNTVYQGVGCLGEKKDSGAGLDRRTRLNLERAAQSHCRRRGAHLDSWLLSADMMRYLLQRHGGSPRISLIQAPGGYLTVCL